MFLTRRGRDGGGSASFPHYERRKPGSSGIFDNCHRGTTLGGCVEKVMTVIVPSSNSDEETAATNFSAVVRYAVDLLRHSAERINQQAALGERGPACLY